MRVHSSFAALTRVGLSAAAVSLVSALAVAQQPTRDKFPQWQNNMFMGGMSGLALWRVGFNEKGGLMGREALLTELRQRIRDVRQDPDGNLYLAVDAAQGGILRVEPAGAPSPASR